MKNFAWTLGLILIGSQSALSFDGLADPKGLGLVVQKNGEELRLRLYGYSEGALLAGQDKDNGIYLPKSIILKEIQDVTFSRTLPLLLTEKEKQVTLKRECAEYISRYNRLQEGLGRTKVLDENPKDLPMGADIAWDEIRMASEVIQGEIVHLDAESIEVATLDTNDEPGMRILSMNEVVSFLVGERRANVRRMVAETRALERQRDQVKVRLKETISEIKELVAAAKRKQLHTGQVVQDTASVLPEEPLPSIGVVNMKHRSGAQFEEMMRDVAWSYSLALEYEASSLPSGSANPLRKP